MRLSELKELEEETISVLRTNIAAGDAESARVLLEHLRATSKAISEWQKSKDIGDTKKPKTQ